MQSNQRKPLTLGVEEEFQLLDPDTLALTPAFDRLATCCPAGEIELKNELHQACCEVVTPPCQSVHELEDSIRSHRRRLIEIAGRAGLEIALGGTHPFSHWNELPITREPRRLQSEYLFQEAHRQCLTYALHIHVGVPDRATALRVMNDARPLLPILYALSSSSPFLEGRKTGLHSSRLLRAFGFPRTGMPDAFESLDALDRLVTTMQQAGLIIDAGQLWWDIRAHHIYPTVEFRICDAVPLIEDVTALAALTQAYVGRLLDAYEIGRTIEPVSRVLLEENRWRAARFGTKAELLDYGSGTLTPLAAIVASLCDALEPQIAQIGTARYVDRVRQIAAQGSAADRQLAAWDPVEDDLKRVVRVYLAETAAV